jgi:hypothetical protein
MKDEADGPCSALREDEGYMYLSQNTKMEYICSEDMFNMWYILKLILGV